MLLMGAGAGPIDLVQCEWASARLAEAIGKDMIAIAKVGDEAVSVAIEEITPGEWADKVYKPDIL